MNSGQRFAGRLVVVTGAGSGIGRATAQAFASEGARVALLDVDTDGLATTKASLAGTGHITASCDVSDRGAIGLAFAAVREAFGRVDVLVNNAGINPRIDSTLQIDEAFYDRVMDVNVKGAFFCAQEALAMMPERTGAIVNLASVSGMIGWGGSSVYTVSKAAVIGMTKFLAIEFADKGIRVNAVCPGAVRTPMVDRVFADRPDPEAAWRANAEFHPLQRVATAEEIAEGVLYLASDVAGFVTGTTLVMDGGLTAR